MTATIHDFAGIGLGPFNLGLACLADPVTELDGIFLDENEDFDWHPGMLIEGTTLQTPFLGDLVTMADPTSPYSFLNYVKSQGSIYSFYIRESFFPLRREFNQYCRWAAEQLPNIEFNTRVERIEYRASERCYVIHSVCTKTGAARMHKARRLVLGTGTVPYIPPACKGLGEEVVHSSAYLPNKTALQRRSVITVLGSGQSAAEIFHDLLREIDVHGYALHWITRSPRFFPLEYSKLTLEMTSPDYVDYFHGLSAERRDALVREQKSLYKGINDELIGEIRDLLYAKRLNGDIAVTLRTNSTLERARVDRESGHLQLDFLQHEQQKRYCHDTAAVVLATGFTHRVPQFTAGIADRLRWDKYGRFDVRRNYSVDRRGDEVFVQNAEFHTHGFVTPDLGMGSYRNAYILNEMAGRECYPVERRIAFQTFDAHDERDGPDVADEPVQAHAGG